MPTSASEKKNNPSGEAAAFFSKVLLLVNPAAGARSKRKKLDRIIEDLRRISDHLEVVYTAAALDATRLVKERRNGAWTLLLCAGGDGTINEVVNGLMDEDGASPPPLGILPTGTGNGLAREIGLPLDPWSAYQRLLNGRVETIYPGKVVLEPKGGEPQKPTRYYLLLAGVGFDAFVVEWVERRSVFFRKLPKLWVYILFGMVALFFYPYPSLRFSINGRLLTGSGGVVAKARLVAGPLTFAPSARLGAPAFSFCLLPQRGLFGYLRLLFQLLLTGTPGCCIEYHSGTELKALDGAGWVEADGELLGPLPATFTLAEKPLQLIYPSGRSAQS
ncbi:MAG: hypothetical protein HY282_02615 [Nitrospirae bacterium]|nr:hypothetical protein [Candidatus Manganitrophaceae bacterium]